MIAQAARIADDELLRWRRERDETLLDAIDPGEKAEHARRWRQSRIDAGEASAADLFIAGEAVFERDFTLAEGLGSGRPRALPSRVERRFGEGGPDALSCRECHGRGGDDGQGELHQRAFLDGDGARPASAAARVPPHVAGGGLVELLAAEMSAELRGTVAAVAQAARRNGQPQRVKLSAKGVEFGEVLVGEGGVLDNRKLLGIDADLVVKPFGWKGVAADLRAFVRRALPQHLGLEPLPEAMTAAGADAVEDRGQHHDGDGDGIYDEITEGQLSALVVYLALLDAPQLLLPRSPELLAAWRRGRAAFDRAGCATCHRSSLPLASTRLEVRAPGSTRAFAIDVIADNQQPPALDREEYQTSVAVPLYSDLRRHDLGPALAERTERGVPPQLFLTRALWGIGDRGNYYLHDGRARSLRAAILAHGGEATAARDAYAGLAPDEARAIDVFLRSLRRAPLPRIVP